MNDTQLMTEKVEECSHLPGPWEMERLDHWQRYDIGIRRPSGFRLVASVDFGFREPAESQQHANARLIAAAPDLLLSLKQCVAALEGKPCTAQALANARADIAKAEVRS